MIRIRNRSMQIPREEQTIGVVGDGMTASRVFRLLRAGNNENDLSSLSFRLDIEYQDGSKNVAMLQKSVEEDFLDLLWTVTANDLKSEKTLFVQIRGTDVKGSVRWHSLKAPFYVGEQIGAYKDYDGTLSELPFMEAKLDTMEESLLKAVKSGDVKAIRVNDIGALEVSEDGENYTPIRASGGGSGMVLVAPDGTQMPERGKLQFANGTLADDSGSNRIVYTAPAGGGSGGGGLSFVMGGEQPERGPALWFDTSGSGGSVSAELLEGGADAVVQAVVDEVEHPIKNATVNTPPTSPHLYDFNIL